MSAGTILFLSTAMLLIVVLWGLSQAERLGRLRGYIECRAAQMEQK